MTDIDLTAAMEAGAQGVKDRLKWASLHWRTSDIDPASFPPMAEAAIEAALPHIREQFVQQLRDAQTRVTALDAESKHPLDPATVSSIRTGIDIAIDTVTGQP